MSRRLFPLALIVLGSVLALATPASASDTRLGIFFPDPEHKGNDALVAVAPTTSVLRVGFGWKQVQPNCAAIHAGTYRWRSADAIMRAALREKVPIIVTVVGAPACASVGGGSGSRKHLEPKRRYMDDFAKFVRNLVIRYGPAGDFFAIHPFLGDSTLDGVEVWNEPNLRNEWSDPNGAAYGRFFVQVARAVHRAPNSADVRLITGGLAGNDRETFMRHMLGVRRLKAGADAIGLHTYAPTPRSAIKAIVKARVLMRHHGDRVPIDITEHGWSTCPKPGADTTRRRKCVTPAQQASRLQHYVDLLRLPKSDWLRVKDFIWYTPQDMATAQSAAHCAGSPKNFYGFFTHDGTAKPSWDTWKGLTGTTATAPSQLLENPALKGC